MGIIGKWFWRTWKETIWPGLTEDLPRPWWFPLILSGILLSHLIGLVWFWTAMFDHRVVIQKMRLQLRYDDPNRKEIEQNIQHLWRNVQALRTWQDRRQLQDGERLTLPRRAPEKGEAHE